MWSRTASSNMTISSLSMKASQSIHSTRDDFRFTMVSLLFPLSDNSDDDASFYDLVSSSTSDDNLFLMLFFSSLPCSSLVILTFCPIYLHLFTSKKSSKFKNIPNVIHSFNTLSLKLINLYLSAPLLICLPHNQLANFDRHRQTNSTITMVQSEYSRLLNSLLINNILT